MVPDSFFSIRMGSHTCKTFGLVNMHESKDSTENLGIKANDGNLAHRKRLAKL